MPVQRGRGDATGGMVDVLELLESLLVNKGLPSFFRCSKLEEARRLRRLESHDETTMENLFAQEKPF